MTDKKSYNFRSSVRPNETIVTTSEDDDVSPVVSETLHRTYHEVQVASHPTISTLTSIPQPMSVSFAAGEPAVISSTFPRRSINEIGDSSERGSMKEVDISEALQHVGVSQSRSADDANMQEHSQGGLRITTSGGSLCGGSTEQRSMEYATRDARPMFSTGGYDASEGSHVLWRDLNRNANASRLPVTTTPYNQARGSGDMGGEPKIRLPVFNGKGDWDSFWAQFRFLANQYGWDSRKQLANLVACLEGAAIHFFPRQSQGVANDLDLLVRAFSQRFGDHTLPESFRA